MDILNRYYSRFYWKGVTNNMEFFDYNTVGKSDDEIFIMAQNYEFGNECFIQLFWASELYLRLAERGHQKAIESLVTLCVIHNWLGDYFTLSDNWIKQTQELWNSRMTQGDSEAYRLMAFCYIDGFGVEIDDKEAIKLLEKASQLGNYKAVNAIGWMIGKNRYITKKTQKDYYLEAAENNIAVSMVNLGIAEAETSLKLQWFEKAKALGNGRACYKIGEIYNNGSDTILRDYFKAFENYRKAAELGYYYAYEKLGDAYRYGNGVEKDVNMAMYWYCQYYDIVVTHDYPESYRIFDFVKENKKKIKIEYLEKFFVISYRNGLLPHDYYLKIRNEWSQWKKGNKHWYRNYKRIPVIVFCSHINTVFWDEADVPEGGEIDFRAFSWLEKGESICDGATLCLMAEAIESDFPKKFPNQQLLVISNLEKAIEFGYTGAMYRLGKYYWDGKFVSVDRRKAFNLIKKAAVDYRPAQLFIGNQYFFGNEFLKRDSTLALKYWGMPDINEEAYTDCINNTAVAYCMDNDIIDMIKSFSLLQSIEEPTDTVKCNIAWMYQHGKGTDIDIDKAINIYTSISETESVQRAQYNTAYIYFQNGNYAKGLSTFFRINLSNSSNEHIRILGKYFYYCGYYHENDVFIKKDKRLKLQNAISKNLKWIYTKTRIICLLFNHGQAGRRFYKKLYMRTLLHLLSFIGTIPPQLAPENSINYDNQISFKLRADQKELILLQNYIDAVNKGGGRKYYREIYSWYKNNRGIINSPIMQEYWKNRM